MDLKIDTAELETTNDLLSDFAVKQSLTPETVYKTSWSRYNALQQTSIRDIFQDENISKYNRRTIYALLPKIIHNFIYDGLFTFSGNYRLSSDPRQGRIYFGPLHAQNRAPKFEGDTPEKIEQGVKLAVSHLKWHPEDHLLQAMKFYQKFVNVHPFYDANGRIGRMIASIYLANHEQVLSWKDFDSKRKFISKLNRCHLLPSDENFAYLVNHVRSHAYALADYDGE